MWTLLVRVYFLNKQRSKHLSIFLVETLTPHVRIESSLRSEALNQTQRIVLVIFKSNTPKSEVHELGESSHTLSMPCGQYIRIMSEDFQVSLNK